MIANRVPLDRVGVTGLLAGAAAGVVAVVLAGTAVGQQLVQDAQEPLLEATHLPLLLSAPGEPVVLRYDVYCGSGAPGATCDASGSVFVRANGSGEFRDVALEEDAGAESGRLTAAVPGEIAGSPNGFSYYAVLGSAAAGRSVTLPAGGASAPHRSYPLGRSRSVSLGAHKFGSARVADERIGQAAWGSGPGEVGLEQGRNLAPIGGSSFDVEEDGTIAVLDEANRRLLRWPPGGGSPDHVPLAIRGTLADLLVDADGTIHVLETTAEAGEAQQLRSFDAAGRELGSVDIAGGTAVVRAGPDGLVVLQQPSGQWMSAVTDRAPLSAGAQVESGRSGQPFPDGREVVVLRTGNEVRAALVGESGVLRTWRLTSDTPLAEVQLAEPLGTGLVLVVRVYTDTAAEFVVLVLDRTGAARRFSVDASDWAETAPLSRFRLAGSSLYQLGSTPEGIFVDRFDLEVE
jgi:hypothetical protein